MAIYPRYWTQEQRKNARKVRKVGQVVQVTNPLGIKTRGIVIKVAKTTPSVMVALGGVENIWGDTYKEWYDPTKCVPL